MAQEKKSTGATGRPRKPREKKPPAVKEAVPEIVTPPAGTPEDTTPPAGAPEDTTPPAGAPEDTTPPDESGGVDNGNGDPDNSNTEKQEPPTPEGWEVARVLKVAKPLMRGDDVKALQNALIANGYHCGIGGASGVFERNTAYAVRCFQAGNRLVVDGKAGRYTVAALGGVWKG